MKTTSVSTEFIPEVLGELADFFPEVLDPGIPIFEEKVELFDLLEVDLSLEVTEVAFSRSETSNIWSTPDNDSNRFLT